jgi:putative transposase
MVLDTAGIQSKRYFPNKKKARIIAFVIDETIIQIGDTDAWLWVVVEPKHYRIIGVYISRHRNMLFVGSFLKSLINLWKTYRLF